jgi:IS4 transposase
MGTKQGSAKSILGEVTERFVRGSALPVMVRATMENALSAKELDALFERTADKQYTRDLLFSTMVGLMSSVVCGGRRSLHAAYQGAVEEISVSVTAVYDKLSGLEPELSAALVQHATGRLQPVITALGGQLPDLLPGYRLKILDGNHLAATDRRLKVLRRSKAGPLPGQCLVILDPALMQAIDVIPCEDGHAQERSLSDEILSLVHSRDVWLDDRNFCTTRLLFGIAEREAFFITRQHATTLRWEPIGQRREVGRIESGTVFEQQVRLTDPKDPEKTMLARRISVVLCKPTRDGDREIHILTNLPVRDANGKKVAELYRERWTLETMFQELEASLCSEIRTLSYPKAALFAFCVALVAYNVLSVVKAALRAQYGHDRIENEVSNYYLAWELLAVYQGMSIAIPESEWTIFQQMAPAELASALKQMAAFICLRKFRRHPRGPKKPVPPRTRFRSHQHVSTARLLAQAAGKSAP